MTDEEPEAAERSAARAPVERIAECGENLVFLQYDERLDKRVLLGRCKAPKKAVIECPWATSIEDFDFETQESFTVWGFATAAGAWQFIDIWENEELREVMARRIAERAKRSLERWDAVGTALPGVKSLARISDGR